MLGTCCPLRRGQDWNWTQYGGGQAQKDNLRVKCAISPRYPMSAMQRTARSAKENPRPETHGPLGAQSILTIHRSPTCEFACLLHLICHPQINTLSTLQSFANVPRVVKNVDLLSSAFRLWWDMVVFCLFASGDTINKVPFEVGVVPKFLYFCAFFFFFLVTRLVKMTPSTASKYA